MNYCVWDIESPGTMVGKNKKPEYFGITGNVTGHRSMCGDIVNDEDLIFQIDADKYPKTENRMRTFHVQVVK